MRTSARDLRDRVVFSIERSIGRVNFESIARFLIGRRGTLSTMDQVLGHWTPSGDELWEIRAEMATPGGVVVGTTARHRIQLDNMAPQRRPLVARYEPPAVTCEIHPDKGGACKGFCHRGSYPRSSGASPVHTTTISTMWDCA